MRRRLKCVIFLTSLSVFFLASAGVRRRRMARVCGAVSAGEPEQNGTDLLLAEIQGLEGLAVEQLADLLALLVVHDREHTGNRLADRLAVRSNVSRDRSERA